MREGDEGFQAFIDQTNAELTTYLAGPGPPAHLGCIKPSKRRAMVCRASSMSS